MATTKTQPDHAIKTAQKRGGNVTVDREKARHCIVYKRVRSSRKNSNFPFQSQDASLNPNRNELGSSLREQCLCLVSFIPTIRLLFDQSASFFEPFDFIPIFQYRREPLAFLLKTKCCDFI